MADTLGRDRRLNFTVADMPGSPSSTADPPPAKSRRERRVEEIGVTVHDLDLNFRNVFKHKWKVDENGKEVYSHGVRIPVSNLEVLRVSGVGGILNDDKTVFVITGVIYNGYTHSTHYPEIALYRTTVKDIWHPNMKGKIYCDCEAFRYFVAYPDHKPNKAVRDPNRDAAIRYAARTHHDPGPSRVRNSGEIPAMCKHVAKLWRHILANGGLERLAEAA